MKKLVPPADIDLTLTCQEIADRCGVSVATAHKWRKAAGIKSRRGSRGVRRASLGLWGKLTVDDWQQGYVHVGRIMRVSPQAVHQMRERLVKAGQNIPKLGRGTPAHARTRAQGGGGA